MSIQGLRQDLRARRTSVRDLVDVAIERIEQFDRSGPKLNSIVAIAGSAQARAEQLDTHLASTGELAGPLHGVTVVVKDCIETVDMDTAFGMAILRGYRARRDARVVKRLRDSGAVVLAKTTMPDLATSLFGQSSATGITKNPFCLDHDPGGSSSGSAVAVAAGIAHAALGTDNGGSIRAPASFCGLVGVRSTPGRISRSGTLPLVPLQDTVGPLTRSVADAFTMFRALQGPDPDDPVSLPFAGPRLNLVEAEEANSRPLQVGVLRELFGSQPAEPARHARAALNALLESLGSSGADITDPVVTAGLEDQVAAASMFMLRTREALNRFFAERPEMPVRSLDQLVQHPDFPEGQDVIKAMAAGPEYPELQPEYFRARTARDDLELRLLQVMGTADLDVLVFPTVRIPAPSRADVDAGVVGSFDLAANTLVSSHSWMPAMTVPIGLTPEGLPIGCEILARRGDEKTLFRAGFAIERAAALHILWDTLPGTASGNKGDAT
jgi:Asp-tRNA(Asn)/Glu-tRNA(Gln) amidotransferase A subunit family amidase